MVTGTSSPTSPAAAAGDRVGAMLKGKWRLDAILGAGGMAVVYAATHRNGNRAAIKILLPHVAATISHRVRFAREAYAANKVEHEGVPRVLDDDVAEDGAPFLVMDLLEGESLGARRKRRGGTLSLDETLAVAERVLEVLVAAHARGIVHRDLKPENLFRTRTGEIKVLDFGLASLMEAAATPSDGITQSGQTMGTHGYMSPEQARGRWRDVDARSDLFSLAATLFLLLSGHKIHEAETSNEVLLLQMTAPVGPVASRVTGVPPPIASWLDRALAYEKEERWPSAQDMLDGLRAARLASTAPSSLASSAGRAAKPPRRTWVVVASAAAVVGVTATAIGVGWARRHGDASPVVGQDPTAAAAEREAPPTVDSSVASPPAPAAAPLAPFASVQPAPFAPAVAASSSGLPAAAATSFAQRRAGARPSVRSPPVSGAGTAAHASPSGSTLLDRRTW